MRLLNAVAGARARRARLRVVLAVVRRRLVDRWRERRTGRRRRWDVAVPPPGAPSVPYVRMRGASAPIPRLLAGAEYAPHPEPAPVVAWRVSAFWSRPGRERASPYDWPPTPKPPASLRRPER